MEMGKFFKGTPPASGSHFVYVCVVFLYTLCMSGMLRHAGAEIVYS